MADCNATALDLDVSSLADGRPDNDVSGDALHLEDNRLDAAENGGRDCMGTAEFCFFFMARHILAKDAKEVNENYMRNKFSLSIF